jgi:hypothetical protein
MGAVATAVTLTAIGATSPVQAATLAPGSTLNLSQFNPGAGVSRNATQLNFFGPGIRIGTTNLTLGSQFNTASFPESLVNPQGSGAVTIGQSTGSFANYTLGAGLIKDLTLPAPTAAQRDDFLRFAATSIQLNPFSLPTWTGRFDLTSFTVASPTTYNFTGIFEVSGFDPTPGIGQLTFQDLSNPTSYSLSVSVPIPTPALLPGLLGLGVAALRNRKAEQSASADA